MDAFRYGVVLSGLPLLEIGPSVPSTRESSSCVIGGDAGLRSSLVLSLRESDEPRERRLCTKWLPPSSPFADETFGDERAGRGSAGCDSGGLKSLFSLRCGESNGCVNSARIDALCLRPDGVRRFSLAGRPAAVSEGLSLDRLVS